MPHYSFQHLLNDLPLFIFWMAYLIFKAAFFSASGSEMIYSNSNEGNKTVWKFWMYLDLFHHLTLRLLIYNDKIYVWIWLFFWIFCSTDWTFYTSVPKMVWLLVDICFKLILYCILLFGRATSFMTLVFQNCPCSLICIPFQMNFKIIIFTPLKNHCYFQWNYLFLKYKMYISFKSSCPKGRKQCMFYN